MPARMPGGGRRYSEDMVQMAFIFMMVILLLFFALVIRSQFDAKNSKAEPFQPSRNRNQMLKNFFRHDNNSQ